jgi:predicted metal-binding protein
MSKSAKGDDTIILSPSWESLFLVCKDCRRRKDGPKHLKARALAKEIKHQVKDSVPGGARIVLTSCLKLCPKKATSVAFVGPLAKPRITAIKSSGQLQDSLSLLLDHRK